MRKVLITGAAGLIGYYLAEHLLSHTEDELVLVDTFMRGANDSHFKALVANPRVTFLELDLTDPATYEKLPQGFAQVYHLAAVNGTRHFYEKPHEVLRIDGMSNLLMLDWFAKRNGGGKFLFTSSAETYASGFELWDKTPIPTPENVPLVVSDPYNPRWSYGASKIFGEEALIYYAQHYGFAGVIIRPHNIYGIRDVEDHVVPDFLARIEKRVDPFPIYGSDNTRSFTYAADAVEAFRLLMNAKETDAQPVGIYNVGSDEEITMEALAGKLFTITGWHPKTVGLRPAPEGSVKRRAADISKVTALTGWKPTTPLDESLATVAAWHASRAAA